MVQIRRKSLNSIGFLTREVLIALINDKSTINLLATSKKLAKRCELFTQEHFKQLVESEKIVETLTAATKLELNLYETFSKVPKEIILQFLMKRVLAENQAFSYSSLSSAFSPWVATYVSSFRRVKISHGDGNLLEEEYNLKRVKIDFSTTEKDIDIMKGCYLEEVSFPDGARSYFSGLFHEKSKIKKLEVKNPPNCRKFS